jgi:hypothetical protein
MKILGLGDDTVAGKVIKITIDGVTFVSNGKKIVKSFIQVERMMGV